MIQLAISHQTTFRSWRLVGDCLAITAGGFQDLEVTMSEFQEFLKKLGYII